MQVSQLRASAIRRVSRYKLMDILAVWHARARQRRQLRQLDDRLLRDIGIDRLAVLRECGKPFWKA
jgi:uncharacterized protein YjiS (DUF1127 family)